MRSALLAMLVSVASCGGDSIQSSDNPETTERPAQMASPGTDPFVEGDSYRLVMTAKSTPGLEKSSAEVKVFIREFVRGNATSSEEDEVTRTQPPDETAEEQDEPAEPDETAEEPAEPVEPAEPDEPDEEDTNKQTPSVTLASNAEVQLDWQCGDKAKPYRGTEKVDMRRLDSRLSVSLKDLPPLKQLAGSISCEITAMLDTTKDNGQRVIATGSHEFYIEMDVRYPALQLHDVRINEHPPAADADDNGSSTVALKVTLIRQGKAVVKGDPVFDKEVEVELSWQCNDNASAEDRSKSNEPTDLKIKAGKAEGEIQLTNLPRTKLNGDNTSGQSGYACLITATAKIEGYDHAIEGKKKIWIKGKDLQVAITSVSNDSLIYAVMKRYQQLNGNVRLSAVIVGRADASCTGIRINGNDSSNEKDKGTVTLTRSSPNGENGNSEISCKLKAEVIADGQVIRRGVSKPFSVSFPALRQLTMEKP